MAADPLGVRGSDVLFLYLVLLGCALAAALAVRWLARPAGGAAAARSWASRATADEIAWLARGPAGVLESALAALLASGRVAVDPARGRVSTSGAPGALEAAPAAEAVYRALPAGGAASLRALRAALEPALAELRRRLSAAGVAVGQGRGRWIAAASSAPLLAVAALGAARIATVREGPVLVLAVLVAATLVFAAALAAVRPTATRSAASALRGLRARHAPLLAACARPGALDPEAIALSVALFGERALEALSAADPRMRDLRGFLGGGAGGEGADGSAGG